ncbi:ABC transporter substrate-binding protein [Synechococcus sp. BA-132 BA5]|nr:ABC transporter substrate-binding protein [Synechococcus sp. BA-132 BA5]
MLGSLLLTGALGCQRQPPRLVLAMNPWPGYAYFALAEARNFYAPRLRLDLRNLTDNESAVQSYISGGAQAIATTVIDVVTICGVAPERCPVIVYVINESRGGDQVLARQDVKGLKGLVGRPIALDRSSLSRYVLARAFDSEGLSPPEPSQLRFLPPATWETALRQGKVQAVVTYPPRSEQLFRSQPLARLFTSRQLPYEILDVLAVEPELLSLHPDAVLALVQGWQAVRQEERRRPAAVRQEIAKYLGLDPVAGASAWEGIRYPGPQEQYELLDPRQNNMPPLLEKIRKVLYANGLIPANTPLPATVDSIARGLQKA